MKQTPPVENPGRSVTLVCLALVLAVFALYGPALHHGFAPVDDDHYVSANPQVLAGFSLKGVQWAFSFHDRGYWHPLTWLSHMLDCEMYGLFPLGHHLTNLLLHAANVLILFMVLLRITGALWESAAAAALFALHPLNVESVVWVASRKNLLSTLFWMLTILAYARYGERPRTTAYCLVVLCFALGLMSKPVLVTLPLVLLLLDYWPLRRLRTSGAAQVFQAETFGTSRIAASSLGRLVLEKLPLMVLSGGSVLVSFLSAQSRNILVSGESVPMPLRIKNALVSYMTYLHKSIWPDNLAFFYPYPDAIPLWQWSGALILLAVGTGLVLRKARAAPFLFVGWFWYLITLLPVIGLAQQGLWPAWADRFAYVPLIGVFIAISWGIPAVLPGTRISRRVLAWVSIALLLAFGFGTRQQVRFWGDPERLLRHAIHATHGNHLAHFNLGYLLLSEGKAEEAIAEYTTALKILPRVPLFQIGLGTALLNRGRIAEAVIHLREAVRGAPDSVDALTNLGSALRQEGEWEEAFEVLHKALKLKPLPETCHNLGLLLAGRGRFEEAILYYEEALRMKPSDGRIHNDLAVALYSLGRTDKALGHLAEALRLDPSDAAAARNLDFIRRRSGRSGETTGIP